MKALNRRSASQPRDVFQLLIVLPNTDPLVWRRVQVPAEYSFWDLHVAIQDAMGWKDCHLHEFELFNSKSGQVTRIGIPDDEMPDERPCLPGWKVPVNRYLTEGSSPVRYRYDFGDDWEHTLEFEALLPAGRGRYPKCVAGSGACPPEDVGGPDAYKEFLRTIQNPRHPEYAETLEWVGGSFNPNVFNPSRVKFDDPQERWNCAFKQTDRAV